MDQKEGLLTIVRYVFLTAHYNHQWIIRWKDIREMLVLGRGIDCFEPIRDYVSIESKLAIINNWLVAHTFDKYVQKDKCWDSDLSKIMDREVHFKTAAEKGHTLAAYNLGIMHFTGLGTYQSCSLATTFI